MKVKQVALKDIVVENRARTDLGDIKGLMDSIEYKGLLQPVTVDEGMRLVAGGRRYEACKLLGMDKIPAVIRQIEGEVDYLEIELMENVQRKDFDWAERAALEKRIFDFKQDKDPNWTIRKQAEEMGTAHGQVGRRLQLAEAIEAVPDLKEAANEAAAWKVLQKVKERSATKALLKKASPEISKATKWAKDHYKVMDAIEGMRKCSANTATFAEVDPPYAINLKKRKDRAKGKGRIDEYNEISNEAYPQFVKEVGEEVFRILHDNSFCIWWLGAEWLYDVTRILEDIGFNVGRVPAIWYKGAAGQTASPDTMLASSYEMFIIARKGQPKLPKAGRSNVFHIVPVPHSKKTHATERPVELMGELLNTFAWPGSTVLVPFLGSGVTLLAAYQRNMTGWGYDLSEQSKTIFIERVAKLGALEEKEDVDEAAEKSE